MSAHPQCVARHHRDEHVDYVLSNTDLYLDPLGRGAPIARDAWRKLLSAGTPVREPKPINNNKQLDSSIGFRQQIPSW